MTEDPIDRIMDDNIIVSVYGRFIGIDPPVNMEVSMAREAFKKLAEDKKNTIIKSGISEFSKKSYSEASTDVITRNCGISKGILFHYFGSKKEFCTCIFR